MMTTREKHDFYASRAAAASDCKQVNIVIIIFFNYYRGETATSRRLSLSIFPTRDRASLAKNSLTSFFVINKSHVIASFTSLSEAKEFTIGCELLVQATRLARPHYVEF